MERNAVIVNPADNVAVVITEIKAGGRITGAGVDLVAAADIPRNHKVALARIEKGAPVTKYGETIGRASEVIEPGQWVHTHNLKPE